MDNYLNVMRARREQILERFYAALDRAGRPRDAARLIAVSKTVGVDETIAAIQVGYRHFAENRPQELVRKLAGLADHPELPEVRFIWRRRSRAVPFARSKLASSPPPSRC